MSSSKCNPQIYCMNFSILNKQRYRFRYFFIMQIRKDFILNLATVFKYNAYFVIPKTSPSASNDGKYERKTGKEGWMTDTDRQFYRKQTFTGSCNRS